MAWFGGKKKKAKKKPPVLEPVGSPAVQAVPAVQAAPAVQAVPAVQAAPAIQPVVEVAPVGVVADTNISVSTDTNENKSSTGWAKKSNKPLFDIHKKLDYMMDSKGKSLEDRYNERFGDKLPESVAADSARKEYNEKKATKKDKPKIVFKQKSQLKLTPKKETKKEVKATKKENKVEDSPKTTQILTKTSGAAGAVKSSIGRGAGAVKSGFGRGAGAVKSGFGRGTSAVKSGFGRGTSAIKGLFNRNKDESVSDQKESDSKNYKKMKVAELKAELTEKGLSTAGKKADLIKRLES
jgi:hypothetical protein